MNFALPSSPWKRWIAKTGVFTAATLLILNPNLRRAFLQIHHVLAPDSLIQTQFAGLSKINRLIDYVISTDSGRHSEPRLVAKFVVKNIPYVSDYENWGNVDYWPTAEEVWENGSEDCDGRAVLAASILRARGFSSAKLTISLDHMWVTVDENEKDKSKTPHVIGILGPNPDLSVQLHQKPRFADLVRLARALLSPSTLREMWTEFISGIPDIRRTILILLFLTLCAHPFSSWRRLLPILTIGLAASCALVYWQPDGYSPGWGLVGFSLLSVATLMALFHERFPANRKAKPAAELY